jgi:glutaredoxin
MLEIKNYFPRLLIMILLQFLSASILSGATAGEIYKWKDKNGNVFFSDRPPPVGDAEVISVKEEPAPKAQTPPNPATQPKVSSGKPKGGNRDEKRAYSSIKVIMYKTSWCGYCRKAREYLQSLGVDLVEYDVERDRSMGAEMLRKSGGSRGVPVIDVEGIIIRGYSPGQMKDAVEKRRGS